MCNGKEMEIVNEYNIPSKNEKIFNHFLCEAIGDKINSLIPYLTTNDREIIMNCFKIIDTLLQSKENELK